MFKIETSPALFEVQEELYTSLRKKEGRLYNDFEVKELPLVVKGHPLSNEWKIRAYSAQKLVTHLLRKRTPLKILEIGCGNGWLCNQLCHIPDSSIIGLDVNMYELEQAERVFGNKDNVRFVYGDIFEDIVHGESFDAIIFGASIQYFANSGSVIERVQSFLNKNGEIHIIDSPFYKSDKDALKAKERSASYFKLNDVPAMAQFYNHHTFSFLQKYRHAIIYPSPYRRLLGLSLFPWVIIKDK